MSASLSTLPITRKCQCAPECTKTFRVFLKRAGQQYAYGHSPSACARPKPQTLGPKPRLIEPTQPRNAELDYRIALKSAKELQASLTLRIDDIDNQIANYRETVRQGEALKAKLTDQHEAATAAICALEQLLAGSE